MADNQGAGGERWEEAEEESSVGLGLGTGAEDEEVPWWLFGGRVRRKRADPRYNVLLSVLVPGVIRGLQEDLPQAFLNAVNLLALITALTFPVSSLINTVVAGNPPSPPFVGTETILQAIPPASATRDGMNKLVMCSDFSVILGGPCIERMVSEGLAN